jgi:hypothetical protein
VSPLRAGSKVSKLEGMADMCVYELKSSVTKSVAKIVPMLKSVETGLELKTEACRKIESFIYASKEKGVRQVRREQSVCYERSRAETNLWEQNSRGESCMWQP